MFKVGDYIVYGMSGVCKVVEVGPMNLSGIESEKLYYTLSPLYTKGSRVFTPVDNQKVVIRPIISKNAACKLIDEMKNLELIEAEDDKHREAAYKEAIKSCDCQEWMRVINTTKERKEQRLSQGKKMSACDERYLKQAQDSLYGEFALSLSIEKDEVEHYIEHRISLKEMASAS